MAPHPHDLPLLEGPQQLHLERLLTRYEWPGNVRELENVLERSINFIGKDRIVRGKHLPAGITGGGMGFAPASEKTLKEMMEAAERQGLVNALLTNGGCPRSCPSTAASLFKQKICQLSPTL